jgi:threonine/homoserine/homoserine lactone efflux protein
MGAGGVFVRCSRLAWPTGLPAGSAIALSLLKVLGGLYLAYLGLRIWRSAREPLPVVGLVAERMTTLKSLVLGFTTQVSNPKTPSFTPACSPRSCLPRSHSPSTLYSSRWYSPVEASWYAVVALALLGTSRLAYLRYKNWVDRIAGG